MYKAHYIFACHVMVSLGMVVIPRIARYCLCYTKFCTDVIEMP